MSGVNPNEPRLSANLEKVPVNWLASILITLVYTMYASAKTKIPISMAILRTFLTAYPTKKPPIPPMVKGQIKG